MRGCFYGRRITSFLERAFPAYAGMFLKRFTRKALLTSFPRVCGDVSRLASTNNKKKSLSPRMRGCFSASVFSDSFDSSFPRVCGDVSQLIEARARQGGLSPRMRGCFLLPIIPNEPIWAFPAYAGMFPIPLAVACV